MELPKSGLFLTVFSALLRPYLRHLDKPSLPKYRGKVALAGLKQSVHVRWDSFAIPHVAAAGEADLFFAQGFLHAQERLWQMELSRRFLAGRTAEIFGDFQLPWKELSFQFRNRTTVELDYFMRLLGMGSSADASLALLSEHLRARLDAYCSGVNRYIEQCGKKLPWEFRLMRHRPEPWRPQDSLTIGKGFALLLSTALYTRLNFFAIADKLKDQPEKLRTLFPGYPEGAPVIACAAWEQTAGLWRFSSGVLAASGFHPAGSGSNSWTIAPTRSKTGGALLCNDPHLRMTLPSIWYLMHLRSEEGSSRNDNYEVWGATIPGCPLVQIGHNRSIAWGITAAVCDDVEIYRETLHRLEPDRYRVGYDWRRLETRRELIGVRRSKPLEKVIRRTRHGPVISDFSGVTNSEEVLSVRWTAHDATEEMRGLYGVNHAKDWNEFHENLRHHGAPSLNFVYADRAGNIGYALAGNIPLRVDAPALLPVPGWDEKNDWRGYIPFDDLPRIYNPPEGAIASANNGITDSAYPYYLSHFFEPPHRFRRIGELLNARERHSVEDLAALQLDEVSLHANELIVTLRSELAQMSDDNPVTKAAAGYLLSWDGRCGEMSVAAAIFHVFHHRLLVNLLAPDLGEELFSAYVEILNQCIVPTDRILAEADSQWFARRSRSEMVALALREACAEIEETLGTDMSKWYWGKIHTLHMSHSLARVPILRNLLSIGPLPTPGDGMTLNIGFYRHSNPYAQTVGASMRFIIDMGNTQSSEFILPSGQSGHPWSAHYADQTPLWLTGKRIRMFSEKQNTGHEPHLLLEPESSL
jgi:penicillin amidase